MAATQGNPTPVGGWLLLAASIASLAAAAVATFNGGNGIAHTAGTYLVLITTMLLVAGSMILVHLGGRPGWVGTVFALLVLLDILGTAAAAYLLMAWILLGCMGVALLAWLVHLFMDRPKHRRHSSITGAEATA